MRIELDIEVRKPFLPIFEGAARFWVVVAHRRGGKTTASVQRLIHASMSSPPKNARYAYIAPYRHQAKTIAWDLLKRMTQDIPSRDINESELRMDMPTGARLTLYGADNYDALRGGYLDGVVLDEVAQMPPETWTHVVRPMLADRKGWALFIGTPAGKNAFFSLYEHAQSSGPEWATLFLPASLTGLVDPDELAAAKDEMTPEAYAQEFELSWTAAIRGAYYGQVLEDLEREGRMIPLDIDPGTRIITGWDLGTRDATAIWVIQPYRGNAWAVVDYYESSGAGIDHYADWLGRHGYLKGHGLHIAPHDISNTDWSAAGGLNRKAVAEQYGIRFERVPRPQNSGDLMDAINATRIVIGRCWFHDDTTERGARVYGGRLSLSLYRQGWNESLGALMANPVKDAHSHAADAFRTFAAMPAGMLSPDRASIDADVSPNLLWNARRATGRGNSLGPRS